MKYLRDDHELRLAYETLQDYKELGKLYNVFNEKIPKIKKLIREYNHKESDRRLLHGEYDSCVVLINCPDWVENKEDAEEWFQETEYIPIRYSAYDCTGQSFTAWHSCKQRNGKWICYHCIAMDV